MRALPSFLQGCEVLKYKFKEGDNIEYKNLFKEGAVRANFTVTNEPLIIVKRSIEESNEKRKNRSDYYLNVNCSCGNNLWIKKSYFLRGSFKCCCKCRAIVREGKFKDLLHMRVWHTRCYEIKSSARKQNIVFNLSPLFLKELAEKQNYMCGITGEPILEVKGNMSLDKKDPKLGYVEENVQWTNRKSNMMKQDLSMEELVAWCNKVIEEYGRYNH